MKISGLDIIMMRKTSVPLMQISVIYIFLA